MHSTTNTAAAAPKIYQSFLSNFDDISDLRFKRGVRYKLKPILILLFLSKLGGSDSPAEIADWVRFRFTQLKALLKLEWPRSPHPVTWKRILDKGLVAQQIENLCGQYLQEMSQPGKMELYNLDGKFARRIVAETADSALHLLALAEAEHNLTIQQTALEAGENEISGARRLLKTVDLENKIISGDAIFAQKELARQVVEGGGEYLWKLRANQGHMYQQAQEHFLSGADRYLDDARQVEKGHGRICQRQIVSSFRVTGQMEFPYLEQVFKITRQSEQVKTGKMSEQTIYGITSLPVEKYSAEHLLELTRKHWQIENGLHYRRDITFKEDKVKKKSINGGQIMASMNNWAIGILRKTGWKNIAQARRYYSVEIEKGLELIINPITL